MGWDGDLRHQDPRTTHFLTRGNVDGIVSAAVMLAHDPLTRVTFVPSGDAACEVLRRDLGSKRLVMADLGLTPNLVKTLRDKSKGRQTLTYLDHHLGTLEYLDQLPSSVEHYVQMGQSAARVVYDFFDSPAHLDAAVSLADKIEYCPTSPLAALESDWGQERVDLETRMLDFCWRWDVDDDRFRRYAARKLSEGRAPSQITEVKSRYLQILNEGRWDRALEKVRKRIVVKHEVGLLEFGRHKPSLFGFGSRAVSHVCRELGLQLSVMLNHRPQVASLSLRQTSDNHLWNLGELVHDFTSQRGIVGGGHPHAAGAKIYNRDSQAFLKEVYSLT